MLEAARPAELILEVSFAEITRSKSITLTESTDSVLADFALPEPWYVLVSVTDEIGNPIPGSEVKTDLWTRRAVGHDGLVQICVERSRQWIYADAPASEDHGWLSNGVLIQPPESQARITLRKLGVVSGTLLAPDGQPLALGRVCLDLDGDQFSGAVTDSLGRFRVLAEIGRSHTLRTANAPEEPKFQDADERARSVIGRLDDVHAGDDGLTLRTRWMSWDRTLRVRVLSPEGEILSGMCVGLFPETNGCYDMGREEEGPDGVVRFSGLPETSFRLWVGARDKDASQADWLEPELEHVIPDGQEVQMKFRKGRWIQGRVFLTDGEPAKCVGVWAGETGHGRDGFSQTDSDGNFRVLVDPLRPSPYRVSAGFELNGLWQSGFLDGVEPGQEGVRIHIERSE
ncbi:MAG: carboxypeptidase regulatory-like domain-containing protein [Planctomycetia bacterium]|nr:carboxypeptidase regulatory-like domain-containing protein [Planctomycetia bacterium]